MQKMQLMDGIVIVPCVSCCGRDPRRLNWASATQRCSAHFTTRSTTSTQDQTDKHAHEVTNVETSLSNRSRADDRHATPRHARRCCRSLKENVFELTINWHRVTLFPDGSSHEALPRRAALAAPR